MKSVGLLVLGVGLVSWHTSFCVQPELVLIFKILFFQFSKKNIYCTCSHVLCCVVYSVVVLC